MTYKLLRDSGIYIADINDIKGELSEDYCKKNFPARFQRAQAFHFEEDRLRCIGAGMLISEVLQLDEKEITVGVHGKPYSKRSGEFFSIAHSGDYVLLAVSNVPVGADIEKVDSKHLSVARVVFTDEEISWLEEQNQCGRFFNLWTMKESVSKALGLGLQMDFKSFSVLPLVLGGKLTLRNHLFDGANIIFPGYSISVCTIKD